MPSEPKTRPVVTKLRSRRTRSWLHLLVVVPLLTIVGVLVLAGSPAGNRWLLRQGLEAADLFLPEAELEVGDLDTDVLRNIRIRELRLLATDGDELVAVESLELEWRPIALLRGRLGVKRLVIREPRVALEVGPDGEIDLLTALGLGGDDDDPDAGPWEGSPIDVVIERAHITGGRVDATLLAAEGDATRWTVDELELATGFELEDRDLAVDRLVVAAQLGHRLGEAEPHWLPLGLAGGAQLVDRPGAFPLQDLTLEDLRVQLGSAVAGADGAVNGVGGTPELQLELALRDLLPSELTFLTGDLGLAGPFTLEAAAAAPCAALKVLASVTARAGAGAVRLGVGANLDAPDPSWRLHARLDALEPHRFVAALPEPVLLQGGLLADGRGVSWPAGLQANLGLALEPGVAWGVDFYGLSAAASVEDGLIHFEPVAFASGLGRGNLTGSFDPGAGILEAGFRLERVPLSELARFGVADLAGSGTAVGRAKLTLAEGGPVATVDGQIEVARAGYGGLVGAQRLSSPVGLSYADGGLQVEGVADASGVDSQGALVAAAQGPWRFGLEPSGAMSWQADLGAAGIRYGVIELSSARAAVEGGIPVDGPLELLVGFDATELAAPSSITPDLRADRAAGRLELVGDALSLKAQAKDGERLVLQALVDMDLASGALHVPSLVVAPTVDTTWTAVEPIQATLVSGGLRDLRMQLRSGDALLWGLGDFDPSGPVDLRLMVSDFTLNPLVPIFPFLPRGLDGVTRLALQVSGTSDALALAGSAEIEDLVVPGSIRDLDARLVLDGDGERLAFQLDVPEPGELDAASMVAARGELPLAVSAHGVALDAQAPWLVDLFVAPGELQRFEQRLEVDDLQQARLSAHAALAGTPAASTIAASAAAELPIGEDKQRVRLELDLRQNGDQAALEIAVAQHMLRQAELMVTATTSLPEIVAHHGITAFGGPPPGPEPALDDVRAWVSTVDASLIPFGISTDMLAQLLPIPEGLQGDLVGGVRASGDPLRPELAGALQLVDATAGDVMLAPALVSVAPADGGYDLGLNLGFAGGGSLLVDGFAPLVIDLEDLERTEDSLFSDGLELDIGGAGVPLAAVVAMATDAEDVHGMVLLDGRVYGSLLDPSADLSLELEDGGLVLPQLGVHYDELILRGAVDGKLVQLDELSVFTKPAYGVGTTGGTLELSGSAMLDGWVPDAVDLRGDAERFWAIDTNAYRLCFSGDFEAAGRWPALEITGDVAVADARFVLDQNLFLYSGTLDLDPRLRIERSDYSAVVKAVPPPPFYEDIVVDLDLDLARATTVQVEMPFDDTLGALYASVLTIAIETRVDGMLDVGFEDLELSLLGEVEPVWGRADIMGARFQLGDGIISFVGGDPYDPILQLEAVHSTAQYGDVAVDITGSLADMGLAFRSDDYPDETDIVSILLTGAPLSELDGTGPGVGGALFNAALGAVMGELESQGGGGHIVDMVELSSDSAKAGRAFGDDIFVTLEYEPGAEIDEGENVTEVTVDWTITRTWNAEIVTGDQGTSSADLYWTWRF